MKRYISAILSAAVAASAAASLSPAAFAAEGDTVSISYNYDGTDHTRQMESLGRGLVAINTENGVFLSWRLLGNESSVADIATAPGFVVYKNGEELAEVTESTNYLDAGGTEGDTYSVAVDGGEPCEAVNVQSENYFDIPLNKPEDCTLEDGNTYSYTPGDVSCGDLDGDGDYELIVKWDCSAQDNSIDGYTGNVLLDAYDTETGFLWRIDLGRNIRGGAHYTQFLVYDFDLDGQAELCLKTAPGSKDSAGIYVNQASEDELVRAGDNEAVYVDAGGRVLDGDEYYTYFESDGTAADTVFYPYSRTSGDGYWGRDSGGNIDNWNRVDRFLGAVAYIDGEHPAAVTVRGYYDRTTVAAYTIKDGRLNLDASHDTYDYGGQYGRYGGEYSGQGNHNIVSADVDDDGKDELITGSICFDDDLSVKWCSGRGHGDALHIGDYDPTNPGLEYFSVHESGDYTITESTTASQGTTADYGMTVYSAATGEELMHWGANRDTGRGLMANTGMGGYYQISSLAGDYSSNGGTSFSESAGGIGQNFRVFWDGDLYDEALDGTSVTSWNGRRMSNIFSADGCIKINDTKSNPALQADLFGDWREELVYPTGYTEYIDSKEVDHWDGYGLRVYTTTELTDYKLPTLMHDPVYRNGVAAEQTAYNQPPHIGFYLAEETFKPDVDSIEITKLPDKTEYGIGESFISEGMEVTAYYVDGTSELVTGYIVSGFDPNADGTQIITLTFGGKTAELEVSVDSGFTANENGLITGYEGGASETSVPVSIDGIAVTGFADGALADSGITKLTVELDGITIGENVFPEGIVIVCIPGSDIYDYALLNGISTEEIDTRQYTINVTYDESDYEDFEMLQAGTSQSRTVGHITYGVGGRTDKGQPAGDGASGFTAAEADGEAVLIAGVGQFASGNRNGYMTLNDLPSLSQTMDSVFETDIMFHDKDETDRDGNPTLLRAVMTVSDTAGEVDSVSTSLLGLTSDTWYNYKLIYHGGSYYRIISDADGNIVSKTDLGPTDASMPANAIAFLQESGDFGQGRNTYVLLDNTKAYMNNELTDNIITVTDGFGDPIPGAAVEIDGETLTADIDGNVSVMLTAGIYEVKVSAEGYNDANVGLNAFDASNELNVTLEPEYIELTGIEFEKAAVSLRPGMTETLKLRAVPDGASLGDAVFESSDDETVSVTEDGTVTALKAGSAVITAYTGTDPELKAECTVTVYDEYTPVLTSIAVSGPESAYIPNTGIAVKETYTAQAYDQNGVPMADQSFEWSATGDIAVENGTVTITSAAEPGTITVTASAGGISGSAETELRDIINADKVIAEETCDREFLINQTTEVKEADTGDIIYSVLGSRDNGQRTGIAMGENVEFGGKRAVRVSAGQWADSNRQARIEFETAPDNYEGGETYVFETDLAFTGYMNMVFLDVNGDEIFSTSSDSLGAAYEEWYHYTLIHDGDGYTQILYDADGNIVSVTEFDTENDKAVHMIDFPKGDSYNNSVYFSGMKYYTTAESMTAVLTVCVTDEDNEPVSGADVSAGIFSKETSAGGKAVFELPRGIYNITVEKNGYVIGTGTASAADGGSRCDITCLPEPESVVLDEQSADLYTGDTCVIKARVTPENTFADGIVFTSSDETVAAVSADGTVSAKAVGTAVITAASAYNGDIKAEFTVNVAELPASELKSVEGTVITADIYNSELDMYAAAYENGVLVQLNMIDVTRGVSEYDAGFEPDKVFLWDGMTPVDIWTAE